LILRRRADISVDGERREEAGRFVRTQLRRVTLAVNQDVSSDPSDVGLLRAATVVPEASRLTDGIQEPWRSELGDERPTAGASAEPSRVPVTAARMGGGL
jgi:hypothetical protein